MFQSLSGSVISVPYNTPVTFNLEQKLKAISQWPQKMLEGFLKESTDPVTAVQHLVDCLETEARYVVRTLHGKTRAETHACTCSIGGKSFTVGYGFNANSAKVEAALNVLTNSLGLPRDRFIKEECNASRFKF
jgi:dsRNA-specific ribonuclease